MHTCTVYVCMFVGLFGVMTCDSAGVLIIEVPLYRTLYCGHNGVLSIEVPMYVCRSTCPLCKFISLISIYITFSIVFQQTECKFVFHISVYVHPSLSPPLLSPVSLSLFHPEGESVCRRPVQEDEGEL